MEILIATLIAFVCTLVLTRISIMKLKFFRITAPDLHKKGKPEKPKIGGIAIAFGFSLAMVYVYLMNSSFSLLIVLMAFLTAATIGIFDDLFGFSPRQKIVLAGLAAIPLLWLIQWDVFSILFLFAGVTVLSNWTNMLAGFNGLETGLGCIALFFLALSSPYNVSIILFAYSAALFAFLLFNRYPAKIFPGDVGTMPIGVVLFAALILGAPFLVLLILLIPYFLDALLKFLSVGIMSSADFRPSMIEDGYLVPRKSYLSLSTVLMRIGKIKEWQLVSTLWIVEVLLGLVTLVVV